MTSIWDWNATPSSNTGTPPTGFGTGNPPSNVRVAIQDLMGFSTEFVHSAVAGGTADALTVTLTNIPASLTDGMEIHVRAAAANATTTPTLNLNSLGAKTITKLGGTALVAGDIAGNLHEMDLRYNLANTRWELLNPGKVGNTQFAQMAAFTIKGNNTSSTAAPADLTQAQAAGIVAMRSYIAGCTLSTAGGSGTMSIAAGAATSDDQTTMMILAAISKTTSAWAVGNNSGGLDTGAIANATWYHFYVIERTDTGVVDVLFSLSASAPTLPANYTKQRRIGSGLTDGSAHWTAFIQRGEEFEWSTPPALDVNAPGTSANRTLSPLTVPTGVIVKAYMNVQANSGAAGAQTVLFTDPATADVAPGGSGVSPLGQILINSTTASEAQGSVAYCWTNTSAQVGIRVQNATPTIQVQTLGWTDLRGRFN